MRIALKLFAAVALVAGGWFVGSRHAREGSFLLTFDVPAGGMTMSCERCRFLSWPGGRAERHETLTLACEGTGPCPQRIGAVLVVEPIVLMAAVPHE